MPDQKQVICIVIKRIDKYEVKGFRRERRKNRFADISCMHGIKRDNVVCQIQKGKTIIQFKQFPLYSTNHMVSCSEI